jgi:triosephosphate isomerase
MPASGVLVASQRIVAGFWYLSGAQNLSRFDHGAYTGEVSAGMLRECGVRHVLVGHSERRALFGESDADVAAKVDAALAKDLVPVVCVGETLLQRQQGSAELLVLAQLRAVLDVVGAAKFARCLVAYEPVWQSEPALLRRWQMFRVCTHSIKQAFAEWSVASVPVLYGGSVKPDNAGELMALSVVDGALVGGRLSGC